MHRAYSILHVKGVSEDQRILSGWATTPTPDRMGDIVEPTGVDFKNPSPLLWQHRSDKPVGTVVFGKPTKEGVPFTAKIAKVDEPGTLKDRVDEAWQSVREGLVRAVSIGFRSLESAFIEATGGTRFVRSELLELSLVTIPANAQAVITTIKQFDTGVESPEEEIQQPETPAATGKTVHVAKLSDPARVRAEPFVIKKINR